MVSNAHMDEIVKVAIKRKWMTFILVKQTARRYFETGYGYLTGTGTMGSRLFKEERAKHNVDFFPEG